MTSRDAHLTPSHGPKSTLALSMFAVLIGAGAAHAQTGARRPAPPDTTRAPMLAPPAKAPPPPRPVAVRSVGRAAPTPASVQPMKPPSAPPSTVRPATDSARTAAALKSAPGLGAAPKPALTAPAKPVPPPPSASGTPAASRAVAAPAATAPPAGATMRCKDGTYLSGTPSANRCSANGGLAALIPQRAAAPPAPLPRRGG